MPSKRFVRRELLDRVARPLLTRLLEPHAPFFAERGLSLDELAACAQTDRRLVRRAHDLLHADVAAVPPALHAHLVALDAIANASGQASLFELCPALTERRLGPEDTAVTALLDFPEAFARAKQVADAGGPMFSDFDAVSDRAPIMTPEAFEQLVAAVRAWMVAHGRSALCELHVSDGADELHLEIEHGRPPATDDVVGEALDLTQVTAVYVERAIVVVDRASGCLSVHASHAAIKELLRRLVGEHLYGNAQHFRRAGFYSLDAMKHDLDAALSFDDVPGVTGVVLTGIKVVTADERVTREPAGKTDLRSVKRKDQLYDLLLDAVAVEWCKFKITLAVGKRSRTITLKLMASRKQLPRLPADFARIVDEWMMARGFIVLAEHRRVVEAEAIVDGPASGTMGG